MIRQYAKLVLNSLEDFEKWKYEDQMFKEFQYRPNKNMGVKIILDISSGFYGIEEKVRGVKFNMYERWLIWQKIKWVKTMQLKLDLNL